MSDGVYHKLKEKLLEACQRTWDQTEIDQKFEAEDLLKHELDREERIKKLKEKMEKDS